MCFEMEMKGNPFIDLVFGDQSPMVCRNSGMSSISIEEERKVASMTRTLLMRVLIFLR